MTRTYVWGDEKPTDSINILMRRQYASMMYITPNLCEALRQLRDRRSVRYLWIDAICVDQANEEEKNHQVPLMADIYRRAKHVCVWLGKSSDDSDKAVQFIEFTAGTEYLNATSADYDWQPFYSFITRPWFRHRWSIQAIAVARRATIVCGFHTVDWNELADALSSTLCYDHVKWGHISLQPAFRLAEIRKNVRWVSGDEVDTGSLWSLETMMWKFHDFEISDPRDAIYALLALAKDRRLISHSFHPLTHGPMDNYLDVYKNYFLYTTKESGSLDVLCRPWKPLDEGIEWDTVATPLWVPQNSAISVGHNMYGKYGRMNPDVLVGPPEPGKRYYNASASVPITNACRFGTGTRYDSLFVEGLVVDAIAEKQPYAVCGGELGGLADGGPDRWRAAGGWTNSAEKPPDAYWRTLVADRGPDGSDTPDFYPIACQEQAEDRYYYVGKNFKLGHPTPNDENVVKFVQRVQEVVRNRRLIHTKYGRLGLAPHLAKKRDLVCILFGCSVPIVLRRQQDADTGKPYSQFIGECYIHGILDGQALELARLENDSISKEEFEIR